MTKCEKLLVALAAAFLLLLLADTLGRTAVPGMEIPVGIVMSVVGGPFFLYMLRKGRSARGDQG